VKDDDNKEEALTKKAQITIDEARMILPGLQALFGFQMISVFNQTFSSISATDQSIHLVALLLTALSIALIMTPAAYHRIVGPALGSEFFVRLASRLIAAAMAPLMISIPLEIYVVTVQITKNHVISFVISGVIFCLTCSLWFIYPLASRGRHG
jgi:hypothetical protein